MPADDRKHYEHRGGHVRKLYRDFREHKRISHIPIIGDT